MPVITQKLIRSKLVAIILGFLLTMTVRDLWACTDVFIVGEPIESTNPLPVASARTIDFTIYTKPSLTRVPRGLTWIIHAEYSM